MNVDIHTVAIINGVDERSCNNRGGRLLPGMNFDRIDSLISARDFEFKKPMRDQKTVGWKLGGKFKRRDFLCS